MSVARSIIVNATAMLRPRPADFAVFAAEIRLLWSGLHARYNDQLRIRHSVTRASSHVQRFITEGAALAVATELAREYGWSLRRGLPVHVDLAFNRKGPRPDLIFPVRGGLRVAGESRGRRDDRPSASIVKDQRTRLTSLEAWQAGPDGSQWFMAWSWFTPSGTTTDFFDPGEPVPLEPAIEEIAARTVSWLWETAPDLGVSVRQQPLRGAWIRADDLDVEGDQSISILVAMTEEPLGIRRELVRGQTGGLEVAVGPRIICAVTDGDPPSTSSVLPLIE